MWDFFDWFEAQPNDTQTVLLLAAGVGILLLARAFAGLFGGDK